MGHKVHPKIFRMQVIYTWDSRWFSKKNYSKLIEQDLLIREYLQKKLKDAQVDTVGIERSARDMTITVFAAKPGFVIGRGGKGLDDIRKDIERKFLQMSLKVKLNIKSVDVTHGFALPEYGISERLPPNQAVDIEFVADKQGTFTFFCNIPCGSGHGAMRGTLIVN